jgi:hypothetical protein
MVRCGAAASRTGATSPKTRMTGHADSESALTKAESAGPRLHSTCPRGHPSGRRIIFSDRDSHRPAGLAFTAAVPTSLESGRAFESAGTRFAGQGRPRPRPTSSPFVAPGSPSAPPASHPATTASRSARQHPHQRRPYPPGAGSVRIGFARLVVGPAASPFYQTPSPSSQTAGRPARHLRLRPCMTRPRRS